MLLQDLKKTHRNGVEFGESPTAFAANSLELELIMLMSGKYM